ncbi:MAG: glycosyltransferase family 8 protein [Rickettsiales bacterium]|jgi:lipopolysaccharide biosynthesis glycosyltransferase|nr:glycosyltransferase family 8 protein [Rickettsiales bacterium]
MNKLLLNICCWFIPKKKNKRHFREKHLIFCEKSIDTTQNLFRGNINDIFHEIIQHIPSPDDKKYKQECISIFLSANDDYAKYAAITMASILYNTNSFVDFYIMSDYISPENQVKIKKLKEKFYNFSVEFLNVDDDIFKKFNTWCGNFAPYNRFLIPMLKPNINRAIYLDVDICLFGDIKDLWKQNLDGKIVGWVIDDVFLGYHSNLTKGALLSNNWFNSGVMLFDYEKWREKEGSSENIVNKLFEIKTKMGDTGLMDQPVFNRYFAENKEYKKLDFKFNGMSIISKMAELKGSVYSKKEIKLLKEILNLDLTTYKPLIRHYTSRNKPQTNLYPKVTEKNHWFIIKDYPLADFEKFWFYAKMTEFYDECKKLFERTNEV